MLLRTFDSSLQTLMSVLLAQITVLNCASTLMVALSAPVERALCWMLMTLRVFKVVCTESVHCLYIFTN